MILHWLNPFANSDMGLIIYNMHKKGCKLVNKLKEATLLQKYYLVLMSADDLNFRNNIDLKLSGIGKGVGVEFKDGYNRSKEQASFRERMKERQAKFRKKQEQ